MLFLLNKTVIAVDMPEAHLAQNWKRIGCGDAASLSASDAVKFAVMVVNEHIHDGIELEAQTVKDLAALLIAKTGANAALFTGTNEARLNVVSEAVLQGLHDELGQSGRAATASLWDKVA